jgi:predicted nucleic acid-binding Zn ribbon protein
MPSQDESKLEDQMDQSSASEELHVIGSGRPKTSFTMMIIIIAILLIVGIVLILV